MTPADLTTLASLLAIPAGTFLYIRWITGTRRGTDKS